MELTLYYSVQNGGDGSAHPTFMESAELTEWDQDHMSEGWGENCNGSITLKSDSIITTDEKIVTKEKYFLDNLLRFNPNMEELREFTTKFFTEGFPRVVVKIEGDKYHILLEGKKIAEKYGKYGNGSWLCDEEGRLELESTINDFKVTESDN